MSTLFIKDLRVIDGRELKNMAIVDNAVISFAYQLDNGIPILSFKEDKSDKEFLKLIDYMEVLSKAEDMRE